MNKPLTFLSSADLSCTTNKSNVKVYTCLISGDDLLEIYLDPKSFILAGDSVVFTIHNACINPSSLWYSQSSLELTTLNEQRFQVEQRSDFLYLSSLVPATIQEVSVSYGSQMFGMLDQTMTTVFRTLNGVPKEGKI